MNGYFDHLAFYQAVDMVRGLRKLTWREVSQETGVQRLEAASMNRIIQSKPTADTIATLCLWGSLDANSFMKVKAERQVQV